MMLLSKQCSNAVLPPLLLPATNIATATTAAITNCFGLALLQTLLILLLLLLL
jgi:hypothetical protein